jgi:phosphoribosyl 1,2-cyclic phosphate phosphodiesterase
MRGKNIRTRASALIDGVLKIDFPPDTLYHVIQYNLDLRCLQALLFTHAHDDHFSPAELQYLSPYFVPAPVAQPLRVYGPVDVTEFLNHRYDLSFVPLELHPLMAWQTTTIQRYQVTPILANHDPSLTCFNYIIEDAEGCTLLYASDTGWYSAETWDFLAQVQLDAVVVECAKGPVEGGYTGHLSIPDVIRMREKLLAMGALRPESTVVTTHFSHLGGLMHHEMERIFAPHHIEPGYDGMTFSVHAPSESEVESSLLSASA